MTWKVYWSGGSTNNDPDQSIGGDMSQYMCMPGDGSTTDVVGYNSNPHFNRSYYFYPDDSTFDQVRCFYLASDSVGGESLSLSPLKFALGGQTSFKHSKTPGKRFLRAWVAVSSKTPCSTTLTAASTTSPPANLDWIECQGDSNSSLISGLVTTNSTNYCSTTRGIPIWVRIRVETGHDFEAMIKFRLGHSVSFGSVMNFTAFLIMHRDPSRHGFRTFRGHDTTPDAGSQNQFERSWIGSIGYPPIVDREARLFPAPHPYAWYYGDYSTRKLWFCAGEAGGFASAIYGSYLSSPTAKYVNLRTSTMYNTNSYELVAIDGNPTSHKAGQWEIFHPFQQYLTSDSDTSVNSWNPLDSRYRVFPYMGGNGGFGPTWVGLNSPQQRQNMSWVFDDPTKAGWLGSTTNTDFLGNADMGGANIMFKRVILPIEMTTDYSPPPAAVTESGGVVVRIQYVPDDLTPAT